MAIHFDQKPESGQAQLAKGEVTLEFNLFGTSGELPDEAAASIYAASAVPVFYSGILFSAWLQDVQVKPQGNGLFYVTAPYGPLPKWEGSLRMSGSTTGGTVHITSSRKMVNKYGAGAPDTVIIGQDGAGAEITVPVQKRSYTYNFPKGIVTEPAADYWEDITGVVNESAWHGRPAGEVLFLGADYDSTIAAECKSSVTFHFAMSRNKQGITIGDINGVAKQGHDLIDIHTKQIVIAGQNVQKEKWIYIQRVYERLDFAQYLGF